MLILNDNQYNMRLL